jgi:polar amino acid transport system substrate-binding protein
MSSHRSILRHLAHCALIFAVVLGLTAPAAIAGDTTTEAAARALEEITWITEQYPPFNFRDPEDGQIKGICVDILLALFDTLGVRKTREDMTILPWARGYQVVLEKPGTAIFSMTDTEERRNLFRLVGPVAPTQVSLLAKKSRKLKVESIADMNGLRIGVIRDDVGDQLIRKLGLSSKAIHTKAAADNIVRMLFRDRLDAIAYADDIARHHTKLAGLDPSELESVYVLMKSHMTYAFHRSTDPAVLKVLQTALDGLRVDGTVDRIRDQYLK